MILGIDGRPANQAEPVGVGNFCAGLLRALPHAAAGASFALRIYLDRPPTPQFPISAQQAEFRILPARRFWTQRSLARELRRNPPDLFYSPTLQAPLFLDCPALFTVYDLAYLLFPDHFTRTRRIVARLQLRHAVRRAARLIAISQATKNDLVRCVGFPEERIAVAHAAPAAAYRPDISTAALAETWKRRGVTPPYLLYVGRIQPRKNIARMIEAFETAVLRYPDCPHTLLLAGSSGWMDSPLYKRAADSPVANRIRFLGYVPAPDLPPLVRGADALLLLSLYEGFGMPVVEALACGTPVLASNVSSLPEVAGAAALYADPNDTDAIAHAMARLMREPALREDLARRGPAQAAAFSWDHAAAQLVLAVQQALDKEN